jgi:WD40 repeat protein
LLFFRELSSVIGNSIASHASTAGSSQSSLAFTCGNVVKRVDENGKESLIELPKCASSLAFSHSGLLAVGEKGAKPRVVVFNNNKEVVAEFPSAHQFGVAAMAFSPSGSLLASSGFLNDGFLRVFSLNAESKSAVVGVSKIGSKVFGLVFEDEQSILAVGNKVKRM